MARKFFLTMAPQGELIHLKSTGGVRIRGGYRGCVSGFSAASRSRLMRRIAMLQRHRLPLFVTLTYPAQFPTDREIYKRHLHAFFMALKYWFPKYGAIWKLEFQRRGAAHYHFFLWGVPLQVARERIPALWVAVVASGDPNHLLWHRGELGNEHCVQEIHSWGGVVAYAAKYLSKLPETQEETGEIITGRIWGYVGHVPFSKLFDIRIDAHVALEFRKMVFERLGLEGSHKGLGFWSFGFHPDMILFIDWFYSAPAPPIQSDWDCEDFYGLESSFIFG